MAADGYQFRFKLPLTTDKQLALYLWSAFGIVLPMTQVCPNHVSPWEAFRRAYYALDPVSVWLASRGFGGKSTTLAALGLVETTSLGAEVTILGGSGQQSKRVHESMVRGWHHETAPRHLLSSDPSATKTTLTNGASVIALAASQASVRGPHPQRLRIDEADEMDVALLDAALGQPMSARGVKAHTVISSTHQHPDGTFSEVLKRAGENGWPVMSWCWRETVAPNGWLAQAEIERKRCEVTQAMWQVEYDLQEPSAEGRAVDTASVQALFKSELGDYKGAVGEYVIAEKPEKGGSYATGGDWARTRDFTVIVTLRTDVSPWRVVAFERTNREPWPVMIGKFNERMLRYPGIAAHDATGLGDVVAHFLDPKEIEHIVMVGKTRAELFSEYIAAVEHGELVSPRIEYAEREHIYVTRDDLYGAGHPPDSFVAYAMARRAAIRQLTKHPKLLNLGVGEELIQQNVLERGGLT